MTNTNEIFEREKKRLTKKLEAQAKRIEETKKLLAEVSQLIRP